jgi:hypothetical protein
VLFRNRGQLLSLVSVARQLHMAEHAHISASKLDA